VSFSRDSKNAEDEIITELQNINAKIPVLQSIYNVTIASANTEQSLTLPASIKGYLIRSRALAGEIKLSHVLNESGTKYIRIPKGAAYTDNHCYENLILYFQSPTSGLVVEVVIWE
jgi:hypothetical protein